MKKSMKSFLGVAALEELAEETQTSEETKDTEAEKVEGADADASAEGAEGEGKTDDAPAAADAGAEGGAEGGDAASSETDPADGEGEAAGESEGEEEKTEGEKADAADAAETNADAEEAEAIGEIPVGEAADVDSTEDIIADDMEQAEEAAEKTEDIAEDLAKLQEASESLQDTMDILQSSLQRGGLDASGAMLLRQNLKMSLESLDLPADSILLPALEDAETPSSRMGMVNDAWEAIKKFLARIKQAIVNGYKKFTEWLSKIWTHLTDAYTRLLKRAEKLKGMLKGAEMATEIKGLANKYAFYFGSRPTADFAAEAIRYCECSVKLGNASLYQPYLDALKAIEDGTKAKKSAEEIKVEANKHLETMRRDVLSASQKFLIDPQDYGLRSAGAKASGGSLSVLIGPGRRTVAIWTPRSIEEIGGFVAKPANQAGGLDLSNRTFKALTNQEAVKVVDKVIETAKFFQENRSKNKESASKFAESVKKQSDDIMTYVNAAIEAGTKGDEDANAIKKALRSAAQWTASATYSLPKLPVFAVASFVPGSLSSILGVVAASIAKAGDGKETGTALAVQ